MAFGTENERHKDCVHKLCKCAGDHHQKGQETCLKGCWPLVPWRTICPTSFLTNTPNQAFGLPICLVQTKQTMFLLGSQLIFNFALPKGIKRDNIARSFSDISNFEAYWNLNGSTSSIACSCCLASLEHRTLQLFDFCSADLVLHHLDGSWPEALCLA